MIATNIEQSRHLVKLGIDPNTADMHYVRKIRDFMGNPVDGKFSEPKFGNTESKHANYMVQNFSDYELLPAWSLSALLELMPRYIKLEEYEDRCFFLSFWKTQNLGTLIIYSNGPLDEVAAEFEAKDIVEAAYKMVVWLKENKKI